MQPHANCPWKQAGDLRNLFIRETFHIAQNKHNPIMWWETPNRLPQPPALLATNGRAFRAHADAAVKSLEIFPVRHQLFQGELYFRSEFALPAAHEAAVLRHLV